MKVNYKTKLAIVLVSVSINCKHLFAQGWLGNSTTNSLYTSSATGVLNSPSVGLGTNTPSQQFHTTAGVRFQGLPVNTVFDSNMKFVTGDNNGVLSYTSLNASAWQLAGNSGTNASTNFVGTTDAQSLVFRTNNTKKLVLYNTDNTYTTNNGGMRLSGANSNSDLFFRNSPNVSGENDNLSIDMVRSDASDVPTLSNTKARIQFDGYPLSFNAGDINKGYLRFFTNDNTSLKQQMIITPEGFVGIGNVFTFPASGGITVARVLDVNCNNDPIRFRDLPSGQGYYLVIDGNGDVYKSPWQTPLSPPDKESFNAGELKTEIEKLKAEIQAIKSGKMNNVYETAIDEKNNARLEQNRPNPSNSETVVEYYLPLNTTSAFCIFFDLQGKQMKKVEINPTEGKGIIKIGANDLPAGMYNYSLIVNDKLVDTKKMILMD